MAPQCGKVLRLPFHLLALAVSIAAGYWLVAVVAAIFAEYGRGSLSARQSRWLFFAYEGIFVSQSTRLAIAALALGAAAMGLLRWTGTRSADEYGRGHSRRRDDHVLS